MRTRLIMSPCVRSSAHAGPGRVGGGATGAAGRLRSANARLREVVVGKDELLAGKEGLLANQDRLIEAQREQLGNYADTVRLHADRSAGTTATAPPGPPSPDRRIAEHCGPAWGAAADPDPAAAGPRRVGRRGAG